MYPAYADGDRLLARRRPARPRASTATAGTVVVVPRPDEHDGWTKSPSPGTTDYFVKRVVAAPGDPVPPNLLASVGARPGDRVPPGVLLIVGDHPWSQDSRQHGYCPADFVTAIVIRRLGTSNRPVPPSILSALTSRSAVDFAQQSMGLVGPLIAE